MFSMPMKICNLMENRSNELDGKAETKLDQPIRGDESQNIGALMDCMVRMNCMEACKLTAGH